MTGGPEALFHIRDPPGVGRGVDCNTIEIQLAHVDKVIAVMSAQISDLTTHRWPAWPGPHLSLSHQRKERSDTKPNEDWS